MCETVMANIFVVVSAGWLPGLLLVRWTSWLKPR